MRFGSEDEQKNSLTAMNGYMGLGSKSLKICNAVPKPKGAPTTPPGNGSGPPTSSGPPSSFSATQDYQNYYDPSAYWQNYASWQGYYEQAPPDFIQSAENVILESTMNNGDPAKIEDDLELIGNYSEVFLSKVF